MGSLYTLMRNVDPGSILGFDSDILYKCISPGWKPSGTDRVTVKYCKKYLGKRGSHKTRNHKLRCTVGQMRGSIKKLKVGQKQWKIHENVTSVHIAYRCIGVLH